jgi:hypothetical protein
MMTVRGRGPGARPVASGVSTAADPLCNGLRFGL